MRPTYSSFNPDSVFLKKPDFLYVLKIIHALRLFVISSKKMQPSDSIVLSPITVPPNFQSGILNLMCYPSANLILLGPLSPDFKLFADILPVNS